MNSNKDSITESFGESIAKNTIDTSIDTAEIVLDSFMDDGILKEIPIIKYAVTTYKIVDNIKGRFFYEKLQKFIDSFNAGLASEYKIEKQRAKFSGKNRDKELTYITIVIERYLDFEKPNILAKLYLAYLDNILTWDDFCAYSEIIDKLLKIDLECLIKNKTKNNIISAGLLRLTGVGLMNIIRMIRLLKVMVMAVLQYLVLL